MTSNAAKLAAFIKDAVQEHLDLYALLGVDATSSAEDIHRAWRKKSVPLHPDRAGANYDDAKWTQLAEARDVLVDAELRKSYDQGFSAEQRRRENISQLSEKRQQMMRDLLNAEAAAQNSQGPQQQPGMAPAAAPARSREQEQEELRQAEKGRQWRENREKELREAEQREEEREIQREAERRVEERRKKRARQKQDRNERQPSVPRSADDNAAAAAENTASPIYTQTSGAGIAGDRLMTAAEIAALPVPEDRELRRIRLSAMLQTKAAEERQKKWREAERASKAAA